MDGKEQQMFPFFVVIIPTRSFSADLELAARSSRALQANGPGERRGSRANLKLARALQSTRR